MDRTVVKKITRKARASGAEPRRDKTVRRSRAVESRRAADRGGSRPANDQLTNELDMTEIPASVEANLQNAHAPVDEDMPGAEMDLAGKDSELPGGALPLVEGDV